jgi:hypothetical protein
MASAFSRAISLMWVTSAGVNALTSLEKDSTQKPHIDVPAGAHTISWAATWLLQNEH